MQSIITQISAAARTDEIKYSSKKELARFIMITLYFCFSGLLYVSLNQLGVNQALIELVRICTNIIGDVVLCTYFIYLYRQIQAESKPTLKWLYAAIITCGFAHLATLGIEIFAIDVRSSRLLEQLFSLRDSIYVLTNLLLFGFILLTIKQQRKNVLMYQLGFDLVTMLLLVGSIFGEFLFQGWIVKFGGLSLSIVLFFLVDLLIFSGLIILLKMIRYTELERQLRYWKVGMIIALVSFCAFDLLVDYQNLNGLFQSSMDFTFSWKFALGAIILSFYQQPMFVEQIQQKLTLKKQIRQTRYLYVVAGVVIYLLDFQSTAIIVILLLLLVHYLATKYVYIYHENRELLQKYEQMNQELEATVLTRTQQLLDKNQQLEQLSKYDPVTQLPNKHYLELQIQKFVDQKRQFTLAFLDLDRFKTVNDWYGHQVGDELLVAITQRIRENIPSKVLLTRRGGDEFAILCEEDVLVDNQFKKLLESFDQPFELQHHQISCSFSIGVAKFPIQAKSAAELIKYAEIALYRAKSEGKNCWRLYEENDQRQLTLEHDLKTTNFEGDFELYYQPQMDADSERLVGCEALIRWHHPVLGFVNPLEFIALAEESGAIHRLGLWVIETAFKQLVDWRNVVANDFIIAINISPVQLCNPNFVQEVKALLELYNVVEQVEFELVETIGIDNKPEAIQALHELAALGIRIAIDDFGTGYSSISYLKYFPVHKLKIARELICEMESNDIDTNIVQGIIAMSKSINMTVIAEGVETKQQLNLLQEAGCEQIQGYYYSKPLAIKDFKTKYQLD
ncbi:MAG: putative bifunctional diguanylate cyclase/phosphodiesterase [Culicoidibacterales bacterium]